MSYGKRYNAHLITGTFTGIAPGGQANGRTLFTGGGDGEEKVKSLSALVTVDAETNTITLAAKWQVSNDASTWVDVAHAPNNPAATVLAAGTSGDDAAVTRAVPAPDAVYGYRYARCSLVVGAVTGTDSDTYSIGYSYIPVS